MPKHSPELIIDSPYVRGTGGGGGGGGSTGGGGGGGSTYTAGDGINIVSDVISVDVADLIASSAPLTLSSGNLDLLLRNPSGLIKDGTGLAVQPKSNEGIYIDGSGTAVLRDPAGAITSGVAGLRILKPATSGLNLDATGLWIGAGDGIDVLATTVAVDVTDFIDTTKGLYEPTANDIGVRLETNSGLTFGGAGGVTLGLPATLSYNSTPSVTTTTHSHDILSSFDVGSVPAAAILRSNAAGEFITAQHTIYGNLFFANGDRNINASDNLTLSPTIDLILDPAGLIVLPNAQEMRTATIQDLPTGINGFRLWDRGSNYRQLTMGAGKFDELYVRVFVADEVRIDRGEEYWSKSYGVVETDFTLPADEGNVDVWFENSPALAAAAIFTVGDWLLARTIDWDTSLTIEKIWFTVTSHQVAGSVDGYRQQWRIKRESGGTTGSVVKKGNVLLDSGVVGQGWIHLSALQQDGGPFIQVGKMTSIVSGDTPLFTNYARFGNLNGTVDYSTDAYGLAAGSLLAPSGIGATPSTGFSGFTVDGTQGLRLFNTELLMYEGGTLKTKLDLDDGLVFAWDTNLGDDWGRYVRWQDSLTTISPNDHALVGAYINGADRILAMRIVRTTPNPVLHLESEKFGVGQSTITLYHNHLEIDTAAALFVNVAASGLLISETYFATGGASILHLWEDNAETGVAAGVNLQQNGTGDARFSWLLTGVVTYSMGIDNSDADKFKLSRSASLGTTDVLTITSAGFLGLNATPLADFHVHLDTNENIWFDDGASGGTTRILAATDAGAVAPLTIHASKTNLIGNAGGAVGINIVTPAADFQVHLDTNENIIIDDSGTGIPRIAATNDTASATTKLELQATDVNFIVTSGAGVGINAATPAADLHVHFAANKNVWFDDGGSGASARIVTVNDAGAATPLMLQASVLTLEAAGGTGFSIAGASAMALASTGRIVLGAMPASPSTPTAKVNIVNNLDEAIDNVHFYGWAAGNAPSITGRAAGGSFAAPSNVVQNQLLMAVNAAGLMNTGAYSTNQAYIRFLAAEAWTGTARGTYATLATTPIGGSVFVVNFQVNPDGAIIMPYVWNTAVAGTAVHINSNGVLTKTTSSERYKRAIQDWDKGTGTDLLKALRPVTYREKRRFVGDELVDYEEGEDSPDYVGLVAEDVYAAGFDVCRRDRSAGGSTQSGKASKVGDSFVSLDDKGKPESLHYEKLTVPLVVGWQDHEARIAELEREIAKLRSE